MKKFTFIFISLLLVLLTHSCRDDVIIEHEETETTTDPPKFQNIDVSGRVIDQNGDGVVGADVSFGGKILLTDDYGFFEANDILAPEKGLYIKADKSGYFVGGTQIYPVPGMTDIEGEAYITLAAKLSPNYFNAQDGASIRLENNASLEIPSNSVTKNGQPYTGVVEMNMLWLDPTAEATSDLMPGALVGMSSESEIQILQTYGMIGVEMTDGSGDELQLAADTKAVLEFPLPSEVASSAPSEIPLWHFNETSGIWEEEGIAIKEGNKYVGEVSHFSWWNCDIPFDPINLCLTFEGRSGIPITNQDYSLETESFGNIFSSLENSNVVCNFAPADEVITVSLVDNCGNSFDTAQIGPYSEDAEVTVQFNSPVPTEKLVIITGVLTDCDGAIVNDGFVAVETSSNKFSDYHLEDGVFSISFVLCGDDDENVIITGYDLDALIASESTIISIDEPGNYTQNLSACVNPIASFLRIRDASTGFEEFYNVTCIARKTLAETMIVADEAVIIGFKGFENGQYQGNLFATVVSSNANVGEIDGTNFNITQYGPVGGKVSGSFTQGDISGEFVADRIQ